MCCGSMRDKFHIHPIMSSPGRLLCLPVLWYSRRAPPLLQLFLLMSILLIFELTINFDLVIVFLHLKFIIFDLLKYLLSFSVPLWIYDFLKTSPSFVVIDFLARQERNMRPIHHFELELPMYTFNCWEQLTPPNDCINLFSQD